MIVYGLETCSVCQKAQKDLTASGKKFTFRDIRMSPFEEYELAELIAEFGDNLVDKKSNDWRGLSDWLKHSEAEDQIAAKPKLMVRPVIFSGGQYYMGWGADVQAKLL